MLITRRSIPLFVAAAAALPIWASPAAVALPDDRVSCGSIDGAATECQTPGDVEINAGPPAVDYSPANPYWVGDSVIGAPTGGAR
jgi:hypothetical protein